MGLVVISYTFLDTSSQQNLYPSLQ